MLRLDAGSFAFVMATGILSVAAGLERLWFLSDVLLVIAGSAWLLLAAVVVAGAVRREVRVRPQSFAAVAATAVLGARLTLSGQVDPALALLALAAAVWVLLVALRPSFARATGSSLLLVVATESLGVLAALLAPHSSERLLFAGLAAWILGLIVYPVLVVAIAAEQRRRPRFSPDLWILMGALAISSLAGAELILSARTLDALPALSHLLRASALAIWGVATCLIAPLAFADVRAHAGWRYTSARWSFVFPLAMYTVATDALEHAARIAALADVAHWFFYVALLAWAIVSLGMGRRVLDSFRPHRYSSYLDG